MSAVETRARPEYNIWGYSPEMLSAGARAYSGAWGYAYRGVQGHIPCQGSEGFAPAAESSLKQFKMSNIALWILHLTFLVVSDISPITA